MSIELLTAVPGGGKTSYAVWHVIKKAVEEGRTVYTIGIPKLTLPTIELTYDYLKTWYEQDTVDGLPVLKHLDHGALIVVDEVQKLWPSKGTQASKDIEELSEHRHYGLTFFLMTQSPSLVHKKVLALVNPHYHIVPRWSGRTIYEWPEYRVNTSAGTARRVAVSKPYKLPKQAFKLYHSATQHIVPETTIPRAVYFFVLSVVFTVAIGFYTFQRITSKSEVPDKADSATQQPAEEPKTVSLKPNIVPVSAPAAPDPIYIEPSNRFNSIQILTVSIDWSTVKACLKNAKSCVCYGQSFERLLIERPTCELAVEYGWPGKKT